MTQSVLEPPSPKRSASLVAVFVFVLIVAGGGYAAYRGFGIGALPSTASTVTPTGASEPVALPSQAEQKPPEAPKIEAEQASEAAPTAVPAEVSDAAPVPAERPAVIVRVKRTKAISAPKAASPPTKPEAPPVAPPPPPEPPPPKPSAPPAKPVDKSKVDLAF